jgi:prophage DNA circulation protein
MGLLENLKAAFTPDTLAAAPAWEGRLRDAAYTTPSGARLTFDYTDVAKEFDLKGRVWSFPDAPGSYAQRKPRAGDVIPLRMFFAGSNYDTVATGVEAALSEDGVGLLEHPVYGPLDVVPMGTVRRRDDLVTAAGQAVFEVSFFVTIKELYPAAVDDPGREALARVQAYNEAIAAQVADKMRLTTAGEEKGFLDKVNDGLAQVEKFTGALAKTNEDTADRFEDINDSINRSIDVLIKDPLTLARQTTNLIQTPARSAAAIQDRLDGYKNLALEIIGANVAEPQADVNDAQNTNAFWSAGIFAAGGVSGSVVSVLDSTFDTKPDALAAAAELIAQLQALIEWYDNQLRTLATATPAGIPTDGTELDTGEAMAELQAAVGLTVAYLVQISFTLKQEYRVQLDRDRNMVELCADLYGEVSDETLDFFMNSNALTGDEIIEIPRGREIVYYV